MGMDYQGQGRAEFLYEIIMLVFTWGGAIVAFFSQQFSYALYSHFVGFLISCLVCLPPWPVFQRKPVKWQPAIEVETSSKTESTSASGSSSSSSTGASAKKGAKEGARATQT